MENYISFTRNITLVAEKIVKKWIALKFLHMMSIKVKKIRTTRKAGGLLWPCKGLLPAAPKDAGFHAVQAQCPCRLGYPLKGS